MGFCNCSMFCCALLYVHSSFAIILMGKKELVVFLSLSSWYLEIVVWFFLAVPWVCLQFVIVVFPDHTHLNLGVERNQAAPERNQIMLVDICRKGKQANWILVYLNLLSCRYIWHSLKHFFQMEKNIYDSVTYVTIDQASRFKKCYHVQLNCA